MNEAVDEEAVLLVSVLGDNATHDEEIDIIWFVPSYAGILSVILVWVVFIFALVISTIVTREGIILIVHGYIISGLVFLALWSHLKTMLTNPGTIPANAQPASDDSHRGRIRCGKCKCYKPPQAHHDSITGRCISRMDFFCPCVNNIIGLRNQKHFLLFIFYSDITALYLYVIFVIQLNYCNEVGCHPFSGSMVGLAWFVTLSMIVVLVLASFTLIIQLMGFSVGMGAIDRQKMNGRAAILQSSCPPRQPIPWEHIFGFGPWYTYLLPLDPDFKQDEKVLKYRVPTLNTDQHRVLQTQFSRYRSFDQQTTAGAV